MRASIFIAIIGLFALNAFAAAPVESTPSDTPVKNFATIENGLYRSGAPTSLAQYLALKKMGVRVVMSFEWKKSIVEKEAAMAKQAGVYFISEPMSGLTPSDAQVDQIQNLMRDERYKPMLIHCAAGKERAGTMAAIYRVETDKWTPEEAYKEMKDMGFRNTVGFFLRQYFEKREHVNL